MKINLYLFLLLLLTLSLFSACSSETAEESGDSSDTAETCLITTKEMSYLSESERSTILSLSKDEMNTKGFEHLSNQEIQKSKVYFKCACVDGESEATTDVNASKLMYTITNLGTIIADLKTDEVEEGELEDFGDVIERFSCEFDGDFISAFGLVSSIFSDSTTDLSCPDLSAPDASPDTAMTVRELQGLIDRVIADFEDAVIELDSVSDFSYEIELANFSWIDPDTTSDFSITYPITQSEIYLLRATLKTFLSTLMIINANDLHVDGLFDLQVDATVDVSSDVDDYLNFLNGYGSVEAIFSGNPDFLTHRNTSYLKKAQTHLTTALDDLINVVDTISDTTGDASSDSNLISLLLSDTEYATTDKKAKIITVLTSFQNCLNETCDVKSFLNEFNDVTTDVLPAFTTEFKIDMTKLFDGEIEFRSMIPTISGNSVNGELPFPTLNGFLVDINGSTGTELENCINNDASGDSTADILTGDFSGACFQ